MEIKISLIYFVYFSSFVLVSIFIAWNAIFSLEKRRINVIYSYYNGTVILIILNIFFIFFACIYFVSFYILIRTIISFIFYNNDTQADRL